MTYLRKYTRKAKHRQRASTKLPAILVLTGMIVTGFGAIAQEAPDEPSPRAIAMSTAQAEAARISEQDRAARRTRPRTKVGKVPSPNSATRRSPVVPRVTPRVAPTPGWVKPVKRYSFTSGFGSRWGTLHAGVDLAAPTGASVYSVHSGIVSLARWYGGYGYAIKIKHEGGYTTLYGHNSRLLVNVGQRVFTGQKIALMGSTGDSTGPHLHFETHVNGDPVEPVSFMAKRGVFLR